MIREQVKYDILFTKSESLIKTYEQNLNKKLLKYQPLTLQNFNTKGNLLLPLIKRDKII